MSLYGTEWRERGFHLWIRDVLIRILILIPVHWFTDLDMDPALFLSGFQDANKFFSLLYSMVGTSTFTSVYKDNKLVKSHKTVEIKVFLNFFAC